MKPKRLIALALVLLGGMLLFVIFDKSPALPAVIILPPTPLVVKSKQDLSRWIPAKWTWLQRVCIFGFGRARLVAYKVQCLEISETTASILAQNSLGRPQAESNGVAVWILPESFQILPKGAATVTGALRLSTVDGCRADVGITDDHASCIANLFSRLGHETIDLSTRLRVMVAGKTNFVAAARAQLPFGQELFMLDLRQPKSAAPRLAVVVTADEIDPAGNKLHP